MSVCTIDPLGDSRWDDLVERHPQGSVFHTSSWLSALKRTYGYEPVVYTTAGPGEPLSDGIVVCRVTSWLTGRRLVSVPFADHCEPLVASPDGGAQLVDALRRAVRDGWRFAELRPKTAGAWNSAAGFTGSAGFRLHEIDLTASLDEIFRRFHQSTIQRNIRRAARVGLVCEAGRSAALLNDFYRLLLLTRRRHGIPPQSRRWFRNLADCFGDRLTIWVARHEGRAVGSIVTLQHGRTIVYKYGCSDAAFHHLGVMPFLFWQVIQQAKQTGAAVFDLGRSDLDNPGLMTFKERLGGTGSPLAYFRCGDGGSFARRQSRLAATVIARLPDPLLALAGRVLYRHAG